MQATRPIDTQVSVHLHSPQEEAPPHPGAGWTRFVCISDTHSGIFRLPPGDVLLHAGDLSSYGALPQLTRTVDWLKSLKHPVKIMIAGNHDLCLDENWARPDYGFRPEVNYILTDRATVLTASQLIQYARTTVRSLASAGLYYLEHEPLHFTAPSGKVWKVYGSPAAPVHLEGAFQYASSTEAKAIYQCVPEDTEILITHTPPYRTLDKTRKGKHVGCQVLASRLKRLRHCRLHVFGHIHEDAGARVDDVEGMHRVSVNAAVPLSDDIVVVDMRD
ncbi:Metallo-dependent phosphatase-like protein [Pisolithus croceorrhizus]|nr:Metallo-dependent phosphatase-like protein [Pisolithus croceorrhizus]